MLATSKGDIIELWLQERDATGVDWQQSNRSDDKANMICERCRQTDNLIFKYEQAARDFFVREFLDVSNTWDKFVLHCAVIIIKNKSLE